MRKLVSYVITSLDGYDRGPDGELDWATIDADYFDFAHQQNASIDTLLFGRAGYEHMAAFWPGATEPDADVADYMNSVPKVVVSSTLERADWNNTTLVHGADLEEAVTALKGRPGGEIGLYGSATLTATLLGLGLVDEIRILVNPVLLGAGRSLFSTLAQRVRLELVRSTTFRSGNVLLTYRPA